MHTDHLIPLINPSGLGSNWWGSAFVVALKADLRAQAFLKERGMLTPAAI